MILPIIGYGDPVLRKVGEEISKDYPNLKEVIANMYETMYNAYGVGLAAPQVGLAIRLFIVDSEPFSDSEDLTKEEAEQLKGFKKTFINAKILKEEGEEWGFNEGCLSIPDLRGKVPRYRHIRVEAWDRNGNPLDFIANDFHARVIQHEYDHLNGKVYLDRMRDLSTLSFLQEFTRYSMHPPRDD